MQKRMIHNDITRSAERRNTLSLSLFVYLCVCRILWRSSQTKKKRKKRLKAYPEGELTSFLDARVLCHHHHAKRAFGITSQIRIKKT
jgi:hypothetical protein